MSFNQDTAMDSHTITAIKEEPNPFEESFLSASFPVKIEHPVKVVGHDQLLDICPSDITYNNPKSRPVIGRYAGSENQTVSSEDSDDTNNYENSRRSYGPPQQKRAYQSTINKKQTKLRKRTRTTKVPEDEEKRKNFLERNRLAALKCRQRKKQWLSNLQARVEYLTNDNDQLQLEASLLHKEISTLKALLNHKNCKMSNSNSNATASQLMAEATTLPAALPYQNAMPPNLNDQYVATYSPFSDNFRNTMV